MSSKSSSVESLEVDDSDVATQARMESVESLNDDNVAGLDPRSRSTEPQLQVMDQLSDPPSSTTMSVVIPPAIFRA